MKQLNKFQRLREIEAIVPTKKFLTFMLGLDECAIDITFVREIKVSPDLTSINKAIGAPAHMVGMTHLFDTIVPIADLRIFFNLETSPKKPERVIIFLKVKDNFFGIEIDNVMDVIEVPTDIIQKTPDAFSHCANSCISEIAYINPKLLAVLDIEKLYTSHSFQASKLITAFANGGEHVIT